MKQIKEKAERHLRENNLTQYEYKSYIEGAGFGANYVFDEIEKSLQEFSNYEDSLIISRIIEKLSNQ